MEKNSINSPMLGYNTNVKHSNHLFHIQTEDSGRDHPHIITHLFTEGTILATKKTSYKEHLNNENWEDNVRQLMKDQHKAMFIELRDGKHDEIATQILGKPIGAPPKKEDTVPSKESTDKESTEDVKVITPAQMSENIDGTAIIADEDSGARGLSIFETPDSSGTFGESLISDKSLDEVILTYLSDELDE